MTTPRLARLAAAGLALVVSGAGLALVAVPSAGAIAEPAGLGVTSVCPTPQVTGVATASGAQAAAPGTTVYITGTNLSGSVCGTTVDLGSSPVDVTADSASRLQFSMPSKVAGGAVKVTLSDPLGGSQSSNTDHDFVALPVVSGLSTRSPYEGSDLTATGTGFGLAGLAGAAATVSYCGAPAETATIESDSQLSIPGPQGFCAGTATVHFATSSLQISVGAGDVTVAPDIFQVQPSGSVAPGSTLTVTGSGFGPSGSANLGGQSAAVTGWSDTSVTVTVPSGATSGSLELVRADGAAIATPTITVSGPAATGSSSSGSQTANSSPAVASPAASPDAAGAIVVSAGAGPVPDLAPYRTTAHSGGTVASAGATSPASAAPVFSRAPGSASAIAASEGLGVSGARSVPLSGTPSINSPSSPVSRAVSLIAPRPLPLPWLLIAIALLAGVAAAYVLTMRQDGIVLLPTIESPLFWRVAGYLAAAGLAATYLLTAVSVLMTLLTDWLPGAGTATLPGAGLYKVTAVVLSIILTGIAARYVYYYWCWAKSRHHFAHARPVDVAALAGRDIPYMKFQVTTRGGALPIVERTVQGIVDIAEAHPWLAPLLSVEVVTESADEAAALPIRFGPAPVAVEAVYLPAGYQTPNRTGLKARALHFMVERRLEGWNAKPGRTFIIHLDEETLVTPDHFLVLVEYLAGAPRPVSQGPILYPLEWDKTPWMCRAMESLRPFGCSECAQVMSNPPPPHLHGSNLVVEESVENRIGWDFGTVDGQPYIAEDLLFGLRTYALLGKEGFGWHGATMLEQPPLSVYWAVQQRLRWVLGSLQGWRAMGQREDLQSIPAAERSRLRRAVGFRVATYSLGFPVGFAGLYFLLHPAVRQSALMSPLGVWRLFIGLAGVGWVLSYQIGLARNLRYQNIGRLVRLRQHLTLLLLTPVTGLFETAGPFLALTRWLVGARQARWTPTPKTVDQPVPAGRPAPAGLVNRPVTGTV